MADPPAATPRPAAKSPSNVGCVIAIVALPIVILIGLVLGTALRDDDSPDDEHVTLEEGELDGTAWKVDAVRDVDGQTCIFLYEDGADDPLNGTCDEEPHDVTYGDETVVFGRAPEGETSVTVEVHRDGAADPEPVTIDTTTAEGMDGRFYVEVVDGDVDAGPAAG
jgi:hypothetical protein